MDRTECLKDMLTMAKLDEELRWQPPNLTRTVDGKEVLDTATRDCIKTWGIELPFTVFLRIWQKLPEQKKQKFVDWGNARNMAFSVNSGFARHENGGFAMTAAGNLLLAESEHFVAQHNPRLYEKYAGIEAILCERLEESC